MYIYDTWDVGASEQSRGITNSSSTSTNLGLRSFYMYWGGAVAALLCHKFSDT